MALFKEIKCGKCDRRYSSIRSRCPYCGARKNRSGSAAGGSSGGKAQTQQIIGIAILIIIIIAVVALVATSLKDKEPEQPDNSTPPSSNVGSEDVESIVGSATPTPTPTPTPTSTPTPTPTPVVINSLILNREDFTMSRIGETWNLDPTISPSGSDVVIEWRSTDPSVASVDANGTVTAVNRGTATVTATVGEVVAECIVRVAADAPEGSTAVVPGTEEGGESSGNASTTLTISHTDVTIDSAISESFTISVRGTDERPEFSVGDTSVATVNAAGKVTAVAPGRTTVYATIGDVKLSCIVRVK